MKTTGTSPNTKLESPLNTLCATHPIVRGFVLATLFAALTALSAQVAIRVPFSPVPITGQVLLVLLAAGLLGPKWAALSQIEYLALGAAGLPVFSGGTSGILALAGPSAGYIFGFIAAAWLSGVLIHRRRGLLTNIVANIAGVAAIYLCGSLWLAFFLSVFQAAPVTPASVIALGVAPFIIVDLAKALVAAQIVHTVRSRT